MIKNLLTLVLWVRYIFVDIGKTNSDILQKSSSSGRVSTSKSCPQIAGKLREHDTIKISSEETKKMFE
jgi:hypothetical protein